MNRIPSPIGLYPFESDETLSLAIIPLSVRYKLDVCEVKLHLQQWQTLPFDARQALVVAAFNTADEVDACRALLHTLVDRHFGEPPTVHPLSGDEPWLDASRWPQVMIDQCEREALAIPAIEVWSALDEAQRHALFVLGRSKHSQREFKAALKLFCGH
jgi:hypothetical protein